MPPCDARQTGGVTSKDSPVNCDSVAQQPATAASSARGNTPASFGRPCAARGAASVRGRPCSRRASTRIRAVLCARPAPFARPKSSPARRNSSRHMRRKLFTGPRSCVPNTNASGFFFNEKRRAVSSFLAAQCQHIRARSHRSSSRLCCLGWERNHEHLLSLPVDVDPHRFELHMLQLDACLPNNRCSRAASKVAICRLESARGATATAANLERFRVEKSREAGFEAPVTR